VLVGDPTWAPGALSPSCSALVGTVGQPSRTPHTGKTRHSDADTAWFIQLPRWRRGVVTSTPAIAWRAVGTGGVPMIRGMCAGPCRPSRGSYGGVGSCFPTRLAREPITTLPTKGRAPHSGAYWPPGDHEALGPQRRKDSGYHCTS